MTCQILHENMRIYSAISQLLQLAKTTSTTTCHHFSTSQNLLELRKLARVNIADNSKIGRAAKNEGKTCRIIHVYNKPSVARLGDKVLVTVKREKIKAYVVGCTQVQKPMVPRFDSNNIVLLDDMGAPLGTRIKVPIPSSLRGKTGDFTKILSIAKKFV